MPEDLVNAYTCTPALPVLLYIQCKIPVLLALLVCFLLSSDSNVQCFRGWNKTATCPVKICILNLIKLLAQTFSSARIWKRAELPVDIHQVIMGCYIESLCTFCLAVDLGLMLTLLAGSSVLILLRGRQGAVLLMMWRQEPRNTKSVCCVSRFNPYNLQSKYLKKLLI